MIYSNFKNYSFIINIKIINCHIISSLLPFFPNTETHDYATCIQYNIHPLIVKHTFAKNSLHFDIPKIDYNTPNYILDKIPIHSLQDCFG